MSCMVCFVSLLRATCFKIQIETGTCARCHSSNTHTKQTIKQSLSESAGICGRKTAETHTHTHTNPHVGAKDQSLIMEHPAAHSRNSALNFAQHRQESPEHTHTHTHTGAQQSFGNYY